MICLRVATAMWAGKDSPPASLSCTPQDPQIAVLESSLTQIPHVIVAPAVITEEGITEALHKSVQLKTVPHLVAFLGDVCSIGKKIVPGGDVHAAARGRWGCRRRWHYRAGRCAGCCACAGRCVGCILLLLLCLR